jgi:hypothetical protein
LDGHGQAKKTLLGFAVRTTSFFFQRFYSWDQMHWKRLLGDLTTGELPIPHRRWQESGLGCHGREGGKKGGKARAEKLSPAKRKAIAKKAAQARWRRS